MESEASAKLTKSDVMFITGGLRSEAVKNLPHERYKVMTTETVYAQGSAVLEACAEENCIIKLGSNIGADYIVKGVISKFQNKYTLLVEIYETEDADLIEMSEPVLSEKIDDLLEKGKRVFADMYKSFVRKTSPQPAPQPPSPPPPAATPAPKTGTSNSWDDSDDSWGSDNDEESDVTPAPVLAPAPLPASAPVSPPVSPPKPEFEPKAAPERRGGLGFSLGISGFTKEEYVVQFGLAFSGPLFLLLGQSVWGNSDYSIWTGGAPADDSPDGGFLGFNVVPITLELQLSFFSIEAGAHADVLFGYDETLFNAGVVVGAGIGFSESHSRRYFYRYSGGYKYGTHIAGLRWIF
jgi:hypothetical protein